MKRAYVKEFLNRERYIVQLELEVSPNILHKAEITWILLNLLIWKSMCLLSVLNLILRRNLTVLIWTC